MLGVCFSLVKQLRKEPGTRNVPAPTHAITSPSISGNGVPRSAPSSLEPEELV